MYLVKVDTGQDTMALPCCRRAETKGLSSKSSRGPGEVERARRQLSMLTAGSVHRYRIPRHKLSPALQT